ncbi:MAG: nicotinamidase/pyrazinamidase, partial [Thermoproteota archaeon]|nr:nicotinamidase/pyrazinamidase [Thermoproteota archaeon]
PSELFIGLTLQNLIYHKDIIILLPIQPSMMCTKDRSLKFTIGRDSDALIVVDVQRDFCPGGALPVPEGDLIISFLNKYIEEFQKAGAQVYATRDWHSPNHISFRAQGGPWPPHCVQKSRGAEFHPDFKLPKSVKIISKATNPQREAYSGFDGTELAEELRGKRVTRVFIGGLATDYCVKNTVLDALKLGFYVALLVDATRGIDAKPGDSEKVINEMMEKGAEKAVLKDIK